MTEMLAPVRTTSADPTVGFRRVAAAVALPLAFASQLAANIVYAVVSTTSGMSDTEGMAEALQMYGEYPGEAIASTMLAMLGSLLAILGLPAALRVLRPSKPRLGLIAVTLMTAGYASYLAIVATNFDTVALGVAGADVAAALESSPYGGGQAALFLLFVLGNLGGTVLLGLAVILSRELPWYAGALIIAWPVGHIVNIVVVDEWFAVAGGALEVVGLAIVAAAALRTPDRVWAALG